MLFMLLRNAKEILRDKLNLFFGLLFPLLILLLLTLIQRNIPVSMFEIERLAPGIAMFGLSFISLFSGMLIAKDRTSGFMTRLFTSPMTSADYIAAYTLPLIPMSLAQSAVCYLAAICLGLKPTVNIFAAIAALLPAALFFIALGLICGALLNDKTVGGVCGALLTNLSAWLSGIWFDLSLLGGRLESVAEILPFANAVKVGRAALMGNFIGGLKPFAIVSLYAAVFYIIAVLMFKRKMYYKGRGADAAVIE